MTRALGAAGVLALVSLAGAAHAEPNIWEKAKTPAAQPGKLSVEDVHRRAATLLTRGIYAGRATDPIALSAFVGARTLLEANGAATSPDVRLRYDLGLVLARMRRCDDATKVLESAVKMAPEHAFAEDGWFELAICSAILSRHEDEERAYLGALKVTDSRSRRATIYSNLSESRMAQGKLVDAIDAAESSIELIPDHWAPHWNLAILKDRVNEPAAALEAARHALEYDPELEGLIGDDVFFEPAYERHWYLALAALAHAERETGAARTTFLMRALVGYRQWLDDAALDDRFRPRANENVARLEKQLKLKK